jgi:hypothetical protein
MLCQDRMTMKRFPLALVALLAATALNAQVYEWKDEKGKTHYSDKPPVGAPRATRITEAGPPPSAAPGNSTQKTTADRELEFRKRQKESQASADNAKKEQTASVDKKDNCENARRMLETLESGERIALRDDKGERYYMDDSQRQQEAARMRQMIQSSCKP